METLSNILFMAACIAIVAALASLVTPKVAFFLKNPNRVQAFAFYFIIAFSFVIMSFAVTPKENLGNTHAASLKRENAVKSDNEKKAICLRSKGSSGS